jgi:hypothetical protein
MKEAIFNHEVNSFKRRMNNDVVNGTLSIEGLDLKAHSNFSLTTQLKRVLYKQQAVLIKLEKQGEKAFRKFKDVLDELFEEVKDIVINHYEEKKLFKNQARKSYERLMMYIINVFQKFELI